MIPEQRQLNLLQAARPLLHEPSHKVLTPFSRFPARDVLKHLPEDAAEAAVLFLGCADGCCLLASLAAAHPGLQKLLAVLDDYNPLMLARAALLLLLAARLDPNSREDMQVLWEVWYCALWTPATAARIKPFLHKLQQESMSWLVIPRSGDRDVLLHIWGSWLNKDQPSAAAMSKSRAELAANLVARDGAQGHRRTLLDYALEKAVKLDSLELAADALSQSLGGVTVNPMKDAKASEGAVTLEGVLQQDLNTYFDSGFLAPNYTGQKAAKPRSVNVTLLRPTSSSWRCKSIATPVPAWGPFSAAELESAIKSGSPAGVTARLCIARMTEMVRGLQAHAQFCSQPAVAPAAADTGPGQQHTGGRVHVQVQLVCMEAVQLCLSMPLNADVSTAALPQPQHKQKRKAAPAAPAVITAAAAPLQFDAIDAGTLADEMGVLPPLVAAGARLKPAPHARLFTGVSQCFTVDETFADFICKKMLHMPLSLTPSILGLRLLTDLTVEGPETAGARDFRSYDFREVTWAPIPAELQASPLPQVQPQLLGGPDGSIEAALQAVATGLCWVTGTRLYGKSTPQLLAWLLASMIQHVDMSALLVSDSSKKIEASSSSSGSSSSSSEEGVRMKYADTQRVLWALRTRLAQQLPAHLRLCFITGVDVLRSSLQQNAPPDWQPADVPPCAGVLQLTMPWQHQRAHMTPCQDIRVVLVDSKTLSRQPHYHNASAGAVDFTDVEGWAMHGKPIPAGVHITDMWVTENSSKVQWRRPVQDSMFVYLPQDHGLDTAQMQVYLPGIKHQAKMKRLLPGQVIQAPPTLAQVLLPAACPITAARIPSSPASQASDKPWVLRVLSLEEDAERYKASLQLQPSMPGKTISSAHLEALMKPKHLRIFVDGHLQYSGDSCSSSAMLEQRQCSTAHKIVLELCDPAGQVQVQPAELHVRWPVAITLNDVHYVLPNSYSGPFNMQAKMDPLTGTMGFVIHKTQAWEMWPNDEAWRLAPAPLDLGALAPLPERADSALNMGNLLQYHKLLDMEHGVPKASLINTTRFLLTRMMDAAKTAHHQTEGSCASPSLFWVIDGGTVSRGGEDQQDKLYIKLHPPLLVTPAGWPVLPCTVVDKSMVDGAISYGVLQCGMRETLLRNLGFVPGQEATEDTLPCEGCKILRRLLSRRARACLPTAAQQEMIPDGGLFPYYYNSYVSFTHCHVVVFGRKRPAPKSAGSLTHNMYVLNRLKELLCEIDAASLWENRCSLVTELKSLLELDKGGAIPPVWQETAQTYINMTQLPDVVRKEQARQAAEQQACLPSTVGTSSGAAAEGQQRRAAAPAATTATEPQCAQCGKQGDNLARCGRCKSVQYCSRECQAAHWKEHKGVCKAQLG